MKAQRKRTATAKVEPQPSTPEEAEGDEGGHDEDVFEFITAIDAYKRSQGRQFPSWSEVLSIVKELGYRKDRKSA